jgi:hypothetical protein
MDCNSPRKNSASPFFALPDVGLKGLDRYVPDVRAFKRL